MFTALLLSMDSLKNKLMDKYFATPAPKMSGGFYQDWHDILELIFSRSAPSMATDAFQLSVASHT